MIVIHVGNGKNCTVMTPPRKSGRRVCAYANFGCCVPLKDRVSHESPMVTQVAMQRWAFQLDNISQPHPSLHFRSRSGLPNFLDRIASDDPELTSLRLDGIVLFSKLLPAALQTNSLSHYGWFWSGKVDQRITREPNNVYEKGVKVLANGLANE
jgi:hypothetical protein